MNFSANGELQIGTLGVVITNHRGMNVDELTDLAMRKILYVGDQAPPAIREQAVAFQDRIRNVLRFYFEQAQRSERTTAIGILEQAGLHEAAQLLRRP